MTCDDWFTEGFDTADLQEVKALLDEVGHKIGVPNTPLHQNAQDCHTGVTPTPQPSTRHPLRI